MVIPVSFTGKCLPLHVGASICVEHPLLADVFRGMAQPVNTGGANTTAFNFGFDGNPVLPPFFTG